MVFGLIFASGASNRGNTGQYPVIVKNAGFPCK